MRWSMRRAACALFAWIGLFAMVGDRASAQGSENPLPANLLPNSWYGYGARVFIPNDIYDQFIGPRLISRRYNARHGLHGSDSCNVGYTSGDPQLPGVSNVQYGATPRWIDYEIDLEQFENRAVAIRFRFIVDEYFNAHEGWFIDKILITNLRHEPDPQNRPGDHTWSNGADTEAERNWMLANNSLGEKPGWHATQRRHNDGQWSWWYGNEDSGTYQAAGADGSADPTPFSSDEAPAGQEPGFEDGQCNDAGSFGVLMTPVIELGENPKLYFSTLWETEGVLPIFDYKTIEIGIDTDRDGLLDVWEVHGVDVNGDDQADFRLEDLHPVPPDVEKKDVYVEIDCMVATDHDDCPTANVIERATEVMAALPSPAGHPPLNPDGSNGITLHAYTSSQVTHEPLTELADPMNGLMPSFYPIKDGHFDERHACCVHYSLWAHQQADSLIDGVPSSVAGRGTLRGINTLLTLGKVLQPDPPFGAPDPIGFAFEQAITFVHELGHNLGLGHGGDTEQNFKPHYMSIMNYRYGSGLQPDVEVLDAIGGNGDGVCDANEQCEGQLLFSEWPFGLIQEFALEERGPGVGGFLPPIPGAPGGPNFTFTSTCPLSPIAAITETSSSMLIAEDLVNWDCSPFVVGDPNSEFSLTPVAVDVNHDGLFVSSTSLLDVPLLDLVFGDDVGFAASLGAPIPIELPEAARRRSSETGDQRGPDVALTSGLVGAGGYPAVRLDVSDLPDPGRPTASVSGLRAIEISGPNVEASEQLFAESPAILEASVTVESNDGGEPRFRAELRDLADNLRVVEHPPVVDPMPPIARLVGVDSASSSFEIEVFDDQRVAATNPRLLQNAVLVQRDGDATSGFMLRFAKSNPAAPSRVELEVLDPAGNRSQIAIDPDAAADSDGDGIPDVGDVCPNVPDVGQADANGDGIGDACSGVTLPNLTGLTRSAAGAALTAASLRLGAVSTAHHASAALDTVVLSRPAPGTLAPTGAPVDLVVSLGPERVAVPALVGLARGLAEATLLQAGLTLGPVGSVFDRHVESGRVSSQEVAAGVLVETGAAIGLNVSLGPASVSVPILTGLTQAAAEAALTAVDLVRGGVTTANHASVVAGSVISSSPGAGTAIAAGSTVGLVVSSGPVFTTVPALVGLTGSLANAITTSAQLFLAHILFTSHPTVPAGQVFGQSPAAGSQAPVQSEVTIQISLGPATTSVSVPNLVGFSAQSAAQILAGNAFNPGAVTHVFSTTVPANQVISQDPVAGLLRAQGSSVDYVISDGPEFAPRFALTTTGPTSAQAGERIAYTITYANDGNHAAAGTVVSDVLPTGATFLSASNGGTFDFASRAVSWPVGSLPVGASGQVQVELQLSCSTQTISNAGRIQATGFPLVASPAASTSITPSPTGSIAIDVETEPERVPLEPDDLVRYRITLSNPTASDFRALTLPLNGPSGTTFETVEQAGGGVVTGSPGTRNWSWRGQLAPQSDVEIVVTARVQACLSPFDEGIQLRDLVLQSCSGSPGRVSNLEEIPYARPVALRFTAPELFATTGGASSTPGDASYQPVREGSTFTLRVEIENTSPAPQTGVRVSSFLPADVVPVGDPPFVAPIDPGSTWNATTRQFSWTGTLAAGELRSQTLQVTMPAGERCRRTLNVQGGSQSCSSDLFEELHLLSVPPPRDTPQLIGLESTAGLWQMRPGVDPEPEPLLCPLVEIEHGISRGPDGSVYVAGFPSYRFDPGLPSLEFFGPEFYATVTGPGGPQDVAYDTTTTPPSLVFVGDKVWRYDIETGAIETILADPALAPMRNVEIDPLGRLLVQTDTELIRIDATSGPLPLPAGSYERITGSLAFSFATSTLGTRSPDRFVGFASNAAGDTLALQEAQFLRTLGTSNSESTAIAALVRLDPDTGYAPLLETLAARILRAVPPNPPLPAFLTPLLTTAGQLTAATFGPSGELYVASSFPGAVAVVDPSGPISATPLAPDLETRGTVDMVWLEPGPRCTLPLDLAARAKPGKVDLTFTPTPLAQFAVMRANPGTGDFSEVGRATSGVYVDFTAVSGQAYDYALDTLCRDKSVIRSAPVHVVVPTSGGRGGSNPPEPVTPNPPGGTGVPEPGSAAALASGVLLAGILGRREARRARRRQIVRAGAA